MSYWWSDAKTRASCTAVRRKFTRRRRRVRDLGDDPVIEDLEREHREKRKNLARLIARSRRKCRKQVVQKVEIVVKELGHTTSYDISEDKKIEVLKHLFPH